MKTVELIKELTAIPTVSGCEAGMQEYLKESLSEFGTVTTDDVGNVFVTFGTGDRHIMLDSHMDEVGMIVTSVTDDGFLKLGAVGGIDRRMLLDCEVTVIGKRAVSGVISTLPPHLQKGDDEKTVPEIGDVSVDIGMTKEEAESVVSLGDRVVFKRQFTPLLNGQISCNCLDDRAGMASIILALPQLQVLPIKVTALFSTQEEVGTRGAKVGAYLRGVDECIAVDVSFGLTPDTTKEECGVLGGGAMIGFSPILDREISKKLVKIAEGENISYQKEIMSGRTGTNADVITLTEKGVKCGLISIPLKYMHSPVEVIKTDDVESVSKLIVAYCKERSGEGA